MSESLDYTQAVDLEQLRRRRPETVERWFLEHADAMFTFVFYRVGKDQDLATDVVQETFVTALRRIGEYDPQRGAMSTWLTLLARNCIRKELAQRRRYESYRDFWEQYDRKLLAACRAIASSPLPEDILERKETSELVHMAMSNIPGNYQRALAQHYYRRRSVGEIAEMERLTEGAVKSLLHRARQAFKVAFQALVETLDEQDPARGAIQ